jgi:hypothetical protein
VHIEKIFAKIFIPVFGTNVTSVIGGYTATVNNNSQDHEANTGDDFHCAEHKFNLARLATALTGLEGSFNYLSIASDTKVLDDDQSEQQRYDPSAIVHVLDIFPKVYDLGNVSLGKRRPGFFLTLQAAEISNGRTVSQAMPYCHPQANPHEGSMKRQMYMVNAPLIGYMTDISASACIMR